MKIYIVRHGETNDNKRLFYSNYNEKLNKQGEEQANLLAKKLESISFDFIISSPLERAKQTAEIINKKLKKEIFFNDLIKEREMPKECDKQYAYSAKNKKIRRMIEENSDKVNWHYDDEENYTEYKERIEKFLKYLNNFKKETILIVSHGECIRMIVFLLMLQEKSFSSDIYYNFIKLFKINNTGLTIGQRKSDYWRILTFNDHCHLEKLC